MATSNAETLYSLDLNKYYKIYVTIHEMLGDRAYTPVHTPLSKEEYISNYLGYLAEFEDESNELDVFSIIDNLALVFQRGRKNLLVYFHPFDSKLAQNDMSYIHNMMNEKEAQHLIIVANNRATPKVSSVLGILGSYAQLFSENELVFNVTRHQLVPKHQKATDEEKAQILEKYTRMPDGNLHPELIPGIYTSDPIVKYYNFQPDDLVRIERPRKDGYFDLTFRIVTHPMNDKE